MKKIRIFPLILLLIFLFQFTLSASATETDPAATDADAPESSAIDTVPGLTEGSLGLDASRALKSGSSLKLDVKAALLYELNSDTMVYGLNIDTRLYPASLTKVMTCLVALENGNLDDTVTVDVSLLQGMDPDGSNVALRDGEKMPLREMLYCLMLASGNDASVIIADHIAGSESAYVQLMNEKAASLGCTGTHFANSHGLHNDDHYTTARDMLKIFSAALEEDFFRELYSTAHHTVPATNLCAERNLSSTNMMINDDETPEYLDSRVEGGKTGFTTPAGRCFITSAKDGDLHYIAVVLGAQNEELGNGAIVYHNFIEMKKLLDFGFEDFAFVQALSPLAPVGQIPVSLSPDEAVVAPAETVTALLPKDFDHRDLKTVFRLSSPYFEAPLEAQQNVGSVQLLYKSSCVAEAPLVTIHEVKANPIAYKTQRAIQVLSNSPWRFVIQVLFGLLLVFIILLIRAAIIRRKAYRRRMPRRRRR